MLGAIALLALAANAEARPTARTGTSFESGKRFGVGVVGVLFDFECAPFDLFVEAALAFDFTTLDDSHYHGPLELSGSVGGRFYF